MYDRMRARVARLGKLRRRMELVWNVCFLVCFIVLPSFSRGIWLGFGCARDLLLQKQAPMLHINHHHHHQQNQQPWFPTEFAASAGGERRPFEWKRTRLRIPEGGILRNSFGIVRLGCEGAALGLEIKLLPGLRSLRTESPANAPDKEPWDGLSTALRRIPETSEGKPSTLIHTLPTASRGRFGTRPSEAMPWVANG
ncbi:hypothetical protein VTI74DRAFT_4978 [Chaetomium olivicolor]